MTPTLSRLPVTVVTGFLGAGKTTLLRHLLLQSGQRLAVLVNEFGDVGIDGDLIAGCGFCPEEERADRLVELTNGCLCCTVQEDFLPTMETLLERRDRLDGIVVETSGLALPAPLVAAFGWPSIRPRLRVQAVVTVVDGEALAAGHVVGDAEAVEAQRRADPSLDHLTALEDLFEDQLQAADLVLLSRADRLSPEALASLSEALQSRLRPGTPLLPMVRGQIDPALVLDTAVSSASREARAASRESAPEPQAPPAGEGAQHDSPAADHHDQDHSQHDHSQHNRQRQDPSDGVLRDHSHHDHSHDHSHDDHSDHDHSHAAIASVVLQRHGHWEREPLERWLQQLIREQPILRLKGRLQQNGRNLPLQIQAVGPRLECWYERDGAVRSGSEAAPAALELVLLTPAALEEPLRRRLASLPPASA